MKHNLDEQTIKKLLALGVPKTRIARDLGVTIEQLRYFIRQKKIAA